MMKNVSGDVKGAESDVVASVSKGVQRSGSDNPGPVEEGLVQWAHRDVDKALEDSRFKQKPVFLLFQEIPGCATCTTFGRVVLSSPRLVEAIETLFVSCVINNRGQTESDRQALQRFGEPMLNNPVVRLLESEGKDLLPRKGGIYSASELLSRMHEALKKFSSSSSIPTWFSFYCDEVRLSWKRSLKPVSLETAVFYMGCFWEGEKALGLLTLPEFGSCPIISTFSTWRGVYEVVEVEFEQTELSFSSLLQRVKQSLSVRSVGGVIPVTSKQREIAIKILGSNRVVEDRATSAETATEQGRTSAERDRKYYLRQFLHQDKTKLGFLSERQQIMTNALLGRNSKTGLQWTAVVSPRQLHALGVTQK